MSKLKEILENYRTEDETEVFGDEGFDSIDDIVLDEDFEGDEYTDMIVDIYENATDEERELLDEMLSSDEGYEELLEMIAEAEAECDDVDDSEETKGGKKKKKTTKVDTKDGDEDESDMDKE